MHAQTIHSLTSIKQSSLDLPEYHDYVISTGGYQDGFAQNAPDKVPATSSDRSRRLVLLCVQLAELVIRC